MKAKGVGEFGICGIGAAVANAIYNATGVRVRNYPITLGKPSTGCRTWDEPGDREWELQAYKVLMSISPR